MRRTTRWPLEPAANVRFLQRTVRRPLLRYLARYRRGAQPLKHRALAAEIREPDQAYRLIIGLVAASDWAIFEDVARKHAGEFPASAVTMYQEIGDAIVRIVNEYDYTKSSAFAGLVKGQSEEYARMKARLESNPSKRRDHRERLIAALERLPDSDEAFELVPPPERSTLSRIRNQIYQARAVG